MIDISKLENVKKTAKKTIARCPACAANGHDKTGNHFSLFKNGKFGCLVDKSDEHRNLILKLVDSDPNNVVEVQEVEYVQPIPEVEKIYPESILEGLVKDHSYYLDKGVKDFVLKELKSGKAFKGNMAGRYVFPIYTRDGRIHGFSGRAIYENPQIKWKHFGLKTTWVYPAYFVHEAIKKAGFVILVESIGDLIALMSAGIRNVLVLFGTNLHGKLLSYLISLNLNKIYIATNNDIGHDTGSNVGEKAAERIERSLLNYFGANKIAIKLPTLKDFGLMSEEEIQIWSKQLC